jgi:hypothetical protein
MSLTAWKLEHGKMKEDWLYNTIQKTSMCDDDEAFLCVECSKKIASAIRTELLERLPKGKKSPRGKDCKCAAYSEHECGCSADWSDYSEWNKCIYECHKLIQ